MLFDSFLFLLFVPLFAASAKSDRNLLHKGVILLKRNAIFLYTIKIRINSRGYLALGEETE